MNSLPLFPFLGHHKSESVFSLYQNMIKIFVYLNSQKRQAWNTQTSKSQKEKKTVVYMFDRKFWICQLKEFR